MRVLKTYGEQYTVSNDPEVIEFNLSIINKIKKLKTNNYNMKEDICQMIGIEKGKMVNKKINNENRRLFRKLLRETFKKEIIFNTLLHSNKRSYFLAIKCYLLRLKHPSLPQKSEFRFFDKAK